MSLAVSGVQRPGWLISFLFSFKVKIPGLFPLWFIKIRPTLDIDDLGLLDTILGGQTLSLDGGIALPFIYLGAKFETIWLANRVIVSKPVLPGTW